MGYQVILDARIPTAGRLRVNRVSGAGETPVRQRVGTVL